jgi:two-component system response regulator PilR (NtrC family)
METMSPGLLDRIHVLVVDEDPAARARVQDIVVEEGGVVSPATSARGALEFAAVCRPSLVVSDLRLGGGRSGVWLLDQLSGGPLASVPVIATSDVAADGALASGLPVSAFVAKPVDPSELRALILGVVAR